MAPSCQHNVHLLNFRRDTNILVNNLTNVTVRSLSNVTYSHNINSFMAPTWQPNRTSARLHVATSKQLRAGGGGLCERKKGGGEEEIPNQAVNVDPLNSPHSIIRVDSTSTATISLKCGQQEVSVRTTPLERRRGFSKVPPIMCFTALRQKRVSCLSLQSVGPLLPPTAERCGRVHPDIILEKSLTRPLWCSLPPADHLWAMQQEQSQHVSCWRN